MISIDIKSIAMQSNGKEYIKFKLGVESENQQRLLIGTKGRNIDWIKNSFITQYCKYKGAKPDL
jgi:GTPase Era involved in 16S rRNA processing